MIVAAAEVRLYAPWVQSLKEKRMVVKSLLSKVQNRFNVSAAEIGEQDVHQTIVLGIAAVAGDTAQADSIIDNVVNFMEQNTEAEITQVSREIR